MSYLDKIYEGILVFPLIAIVITFPYGMYQYHKYGSVSKYRTLILYSFILYMLIAYFQVILPLPKLSSTQGNTWREHLNLIPFRQVWIYWRYRVFSLRALLAYLKSFSLKQLLLNVVLTIPYGVYLCYYFKQSFRRTLLYSFLLSLFFELSQLTALFGIYPGPYRLADVEDLLCNTLGGILGYQLGHVFSRFLPRREEIDARCRAAGRIVSGKRRFWAALFDFGCSVLLYMFLGAIFVLLRSRLAGQEWVHIWSFFCLFELAQVLLADGLTIGHGLCRMILVSEDGGAASKKQLIKRYFCLWLLTGLPLFLTELLAGALAGTGGQWIASLLRALSRLYLLLYLIRQFFGKTAKPMLHDRFSGTVYMAIQLPEDRPDADS